MTFDCEHPDDGYQAVCPLCGALRTGPMVRPGPLSITPRACPGGVVIHVYAATVPPVLLVAQRVGPADDVEAAALMAAAVADAADALETCLVAYDGDTGARFSGPDWLRRPE